MSPTSAAARKPNRALTAVRQSMNLSLDDFAKAVRQAGAELGEPNDCSKHHVYRWESGMVKMCRPVYRRALQALTGKTPAELGFTINRHEHGASGQKPTDALSRLPAPARVPSAAVLPTADFERVEVVVVAGAQHRAAGGPNEALRAARKRRGWKHPQLIHALKQAAAAQGVALPSDDSVKRQISRWENNGQRPDEFYTPLLCAVYGMPPAELGILAQPPMSPVDYPSTPEASVEELAALSTMDVNEDPHLLNAAPLPDGWSTPAVAWLLGRPEEVIERPNGRRVGMEDVAAIRAMSQQFMALDLKFGGGFARTALAQVYRRDVRPMLEGKYTEEVGSALFEATAELVKMLGWSAYDTGQHGAAQRYFVHGLRLAQASGNRMLGGTLLAYLSHQANYLGQHAEAANLARAAQEGARAYATPTVMAMYAAHEARAHAAVGDQRAATAAMRDAERYFARSRPDDGPEWLYYFDAAELAGEFAHCFRDLGQANAGLEYVEQAVATTDPAYTRTLGFVRMVRASVDLRRGELEASLDAAHAALQTAGDLKSVRFRRYVTDYLDELTPFADMPAVREFAVSIGSHSD